MRELLIFTLIVLGIIGQAENQHHVPVIDGAVEIDEEKVELQQNKYDDEHIKPNLSPWVLQEFKWLKQNQEFPQAESFVCQLKVGASFSFRWVPHTKSKQLKILLSVFTQQTGNDLTYMKNPDQDQFLKVQGKSFPNQDYKTIGNLYVTKALLVPFDSQNKMMKLTNLYDRNVVIQVLLENTQQKINPYVVAKNDNFTIPLTKLQAIYQQIKQTDGNRNRMYKWQWGFLQRQEHYEQQMLKLTAVELIAILATGIIQMYCIKGLLDSSNPIV